MGEKKREKELGKSQRRKRDEKQREKESDRQGN